MQLPEIYRCIVVCRCSVFGCIRVSVDSILCTASMIASLVLAWINQILAALLGMVLALASLIPIPRLRQWCPPQIAIFDGLIAVTIGIVLYVLILWAFVSLFGSGDDAAKSSIATNDERAAWGQIRRSEELSSDVSGYSLSTENEDVDETQALKDFDDYEKLQTPNENDQTDLVCECRVQNPLDDPFDDEFDGSEATKLGPRISDTHASLERPTGGNRLKTPLEYQERLLGLSIVNRDAVDVAPADFQTAETQVRPKSRGADREARADALEQFTMHILEISPEEAIIEESEYTESMSSLAPCGHCGADYCDDTTCQCGQTSNEAPNGPSANINMNREMTGAEGEEEKTRIPRENDLSVEKTDRSVDLAWWVSQVNPKYDDEESLTLTLDTEFENVNNNNEWKNERFSSLGGDSSSSSATLKEGRKRASSSTDSSDYKTAEEENHNNNAKRGSLTDALAEGDGHALRTKRWHRGERPAALIQNRSQARNDRQRSGQEARRWPAGRRWRNARRRSTSTVSEESKMSTTDTTMRSSLQSEMPSTTDGLALISPSPITLNTPSSEAELTLTQQLRASKYPRLILEGGGDCGVNQLNNRLYFMDTYQQHIFQKTAVHVFGTTNLETFYEQN